MAKTKMKGLGGSPVEPETEVEQVEAIPFADRVKKFRDKFKLGPHHKMERFTVMLGATLSFMLLFTAVSYAGHQSKLATQASVQSVFTTDFTYSLSQQPGKVVGVYGDEDRKDVMVLFQMTDPAGMSADASNYEVFLTGEKDEMAYQPDVTFALFGSTGYGMIRFENDTRLENEILNIIVRSKSALTEAIEVVDEDTIVDESFAEFDQVQIYVNPGADDIHVIEGVAVGEDDPAKLYTALVAEEKDEEIRGRIAEQTKQMDSLLNKSNEYMNRLISSGYKPPATPWFVEGDYVDDEDVLRPATYLLAAHKVDYAGKTLRDGYINQVADGLAGFDAYVTDHAKRIDKASADDKTPREDVEKPTTVERDDGTVLDLTTVTTGTSPTAQVAAKDSVDVLTTTWQTYLSNKSKLQSETMLELLILDADVLSQPSLYSEASGEKTVFFY